MLHTSKQNLMILALICLMSGYTLSQHTSRQDIVDIAAGNPQFSTLVAAVKAANLVNALKGDGPFTVFAPTNAAFEALPAGTLESLLKPENRDQLTAILTYHVVASSVDAATASSLRFANTLNGQRLDLTSKSGTLRIDKANVIKVDIRASNGIVHVVDRVLLPETKNIPEIAADAGQFSTLLSAVKAAGLVETLVGKGPFTVFAPTDAAFAKLPSGTLVDLLKPENRDRLSQILTYHVVSGRVYADDALKARRFKTVSGNSAAAQLSDGKLMINQANVISTDIEAANGVVHVIDKVLLPDAAETAGLPALDLIDLAIQRGVTLYNHGQAEACAAVYEVTARALLDLDAGLPVAAQDKLARSLEKIATTPSASRRAWILRYALDDVSAVLSEGMARM